MKEKSKFYFHVPVNNHFTIQKALIKVAQIDLHIPIVHKTIYEFKILNKIFLKTPLTKEAIPG